MIDSPEQNAAMAEKLALPFPILSDPNGAAATKRFVVWEPEEDTAKPAIIVIAPDGSEGYRYVGADFMDRPNDDDVLRALEVLHLPPIARMADPVPHLPPAPGRSAVKLAHLGVNMRGVRFAMEAMAERARDPQDRTEAERTARMAERFVAAQGATLRATAKRG